MIKDHKNLLLVRLATTQPVTDPATLPILRGLQQLGTPGRSTDFSQMLEFSIAHRVCMTRLHVPFRGPYAHKPHVMRLQVRKPTNLGSGSQKRVDWLKSQGA